MTQPTGWSPDPISEESMVSAGSSLVPLPDIKRARQGEAMPVIAAVGRSEVGGQSSGSMQEGASSGDEPDDVEVEKIKLDINVSRLKLAKALKRSSRSSAWRPRQGLWPIRLLGRAGR